MFRGRYLNGEADLKASLEDGVLIVTLASFEVNGKKAPEEFMTEVREQNVAKDFYKDRSRPRDSASSSAWKSRMARSSSAFELSPPKSQIPPPAKGGSSRSRWWLPTERRADNRRRRTSERRRSKTKLEPAAAGSAAPKT